MNRLGDARQLLYEAIADCLPGRVNPYPLPGPSRGLAPYVWIDDASVATQPSGRNGRVIVATFPVWIVYDGAVHAQVAGLDDLVAAVWDACEATAGVSPVTAGPRTVAADVTAAAAAAAARLGAHRRGDDRRPFVLCSRPDVGDDSAARNP
jgi:hypothetical protein